MERKLAMPVDDETGFQLSEQCPACETGGDMRIGTPCRPVEADMITPPKAKTHDELVAEITALRALVGECLEEDDDG